MNFSLLAAVSQGFLALIGVVTFINFVLLLSVLQLSVRFRTVAYVLTDGKGTFVQ